MLLNKFVNFARPAINTVIINAMRNFLTFNLNHKVEFQDIVNEPLSNIWE